MTYIRTLGSGMKVPRHSIAAIFVMTVLAASAQMYLTTRLLPKDVSTGQYFAFTITSTNTGGMIDFLVTVTPKTSEFFYEARLACFDGKGEITQVSLEYPEYSHDRGEPCEYRFGVGSNMLTHSQFILRYSKRKHFEKERAVDTIWFFLRDFTPSARPNNGAAAKCRPALESDV